MAEDDMRLRRVGIYVRLCNDFAEQAEYKSPDYETTKMLVQQFPWMSSHPWSENGIPDSFETQDFSVLRELREEFAIIAKTYDKALAYSYECAARDIARLQKEQRNADIKYALDHGTPEQIEKLLNAGGEFFNKHFNNAESPYYGTYAPAEGFAFNLIMSRFRDDQDRFGPKGMR